MRLLLFSFFLPLITSTRISIPSTPATVDVLLREARCESYCFTECYKMNFDNIATTFCAACKSKCEEARATASRKKIKAFLTPSLIVSNRERGEIELDVSLSSDCPQCLVVLEYRFMASSGTISKWIPFQIVTPGVYTYGKLNLDSAYQFRTHLIHLWQSKKVSLTQWADLSVEP